MQQVTAKCSLVRVCNWALYEIKFDVRLILPWDATAVTKSFQLLIRSLPHYTRSTADPTNQIGITRSHPRDFKIKP